MADIVQPPDHPSFPPFPAQPAVEDARDDGKAFAVAAIIGGALIAIGVFLPGVVAVTQYGVINHTLMEAKDFGVSDGFMLLLVGAALVAEGAHVLVGAKEARRNPRKQRVTVALCALAAGGLAGYDLYLNQFTIQAYINQFYPYATEYFGPGLYTVIVGAVIAFGGTPVRAR